MPDRKGLGFAETANLQGAPGDRPVSTLGGAGDCAPGIKPSPLIPHPEETFPLPLRAATFNDTDTAPIAGAD